MKISKRILLSLLSLLPIPSVSLAASQELMMDTPNLTQRGSRLRDMFDAQYFSPDFYEKMNAIGVRRGSDFLQIKDEEVRKYIREAVKAEVVESGHSGSPSPQ